MITIKKHFVIPVFIIALVVATSGCLKTGYNGLTDSDNKNLTAVNYTYRFLYDDTLQKGTLKQEIQLNRVCEVVFKKISTSIQENGLMGYSTELRYDINSVMKAGPSGSVTRQMLFAEFQKHIQSDQLSNLWVFITISDVAKVTPMAGAPELGKPGDFSSDKIYRITASNGSYKDYIIRTIKKF